tara:strand:+ start:804 stop:1853 length:1050 start_codon:yes stop_codon:yes gene_type:complete
MTSILAQSTNEEFQPYKGIVKWFNTEKGFGVITHKDDTIITEYFVHHSDIKNSTSARSFLEEGENVLFTPSSEPNGKLKATLLKSAEPGGFRYLAKIQSRKSGNRNTTSFKPQEKCCNLRIITGFSALDILFSGNLSTRDIGIYDPFLQYGLLHTSRFLAEQDGTLETSIPDKVDPLTWYNFFKEEITAVEQDNKDFMKLWHGDSHLIADDKMADGKWKEQCPRFVNLIKTISYIFKMKVTSTRINEYRNGDDWKPYHHDAAAIKEHMKKIQNITVSVSFGATRSVAFQNAKNLSTMSFPIMDGTIYSFGQQVNIDYKHGILKEESNSGPRISVILWGWVDQKEPDSYQ